MGKETRKIKDLKSFDSSYELKRKIRALSDTEKLNAFIYYDSNNKEDYLSVKLNIAELINDDYIKLSVIKRIKNENDILEIATTLKRDENKINVLNIINSNSESQLKTMLVLSFKQDDNKLNVLDEIQDEKDRVKIVISLKNDKNKLKVLENFKEINLKELIVESLKNDAYKVEFLEKYGDKLNQLSKERLIFSLNKDNSKIKYIDKLTKLESKIEIIKSLKEDKLKKEYLKEYEEELDLLDKSKIIASIKDDKLKLIFIEKVEDINEKAEMIETLQSDNLKIDFLEYNKELLDLDKKVQLIRSLKSDDIKIKFLNKIDSEQCKLEIIRTLKNKEKMYQALLKTKKSKIVKELSKNSDKKVLKQVISSDNCQWYEMLAVAQNYTIGKGKLEKDVISKIIRNFKYIEILVEIAKNPNVNEEELYSLLDILENDMTSYKSINNYKNKFEEKNIKIEELKNEIILLIVNNQNVTNDILDEIEENNDIKDVKLIKAINLARVKVKNRERSIFVRVKNTEKEIEPIVIKANETKQEKEKEKLIKVSKQQKDNSSKEEIWNKLMQSDDRARTELVLNEDFPEEFLEKLKKDFCEDVRLAIIENPNISINDKLDMINDESEKVRLLLIYEINKTNEVVRVLDETEEEKNRKKEFYKAYIPFKYKEKIKLAEKTNNETQIEELLKNDKWFIDIALINNINVKKEQILDIAKRTNYVEVIAEILESSKLDENKLIDIYNDLHNLYFESKNNKLKSIIEGKDVNKKNSKILIYKAIAKNPNADKELLENIYFDSSSCDEEVRLAILKNKNVTRDLVKLIETDYTKPEWESKIKEAVFLAKQRIKNNMIMNYLQEIEIEYETSNPKEKILRKFTQIHYNKETDDNLCDIVENIIQKLNKRKIRLNELSKDSIEKLIQYSQTPNEIIEELIELDIYGLNEIFDQNRFFYEEKIETYIKEGKEVKKEFENKLNNIEEKEVLKDTIDNEKKHKDTFVSRQMFENTFENTIEDKRMMKPKTVKTVNNVAVSSNTINVIKNDAKETSGEIIQKKFIKKKRAMDLIKKKSPKIMLDLLNNYDINDKEIEEIRKRTTDFRVYEAIAKHELTNGGTLKKLSKVDYFKDRNTKVANIIRENTDDLMRMTIRIKQLVAGHKNTDRNTLIKLTKYPDSTVISIAETNLKMRKNWKTGLIKNTYKSVKTTKEHPQGSTEIQKW